MSTENSGRVVVETMESRRTGKDLQNKTGSVPESRRSKRRQRVPDEIGSLLFHQSLKKRPLIPEEMYGDEGVSVENVYLILTPDTD